MSPIGSVQGRSVFTGNQPDDCAVVGLLARGDDICVLGTGFGAATRAILAARPGARITCVDNDPGVLAMADGVTRRLCDEPRVSFVRADALDFLVDSERAWGGFVVDLYTPTGYPEIVLRREFWTRLSELSARTGAPVLVNTWGVPQQLGQFEFWNAHSVVAGIIEESRGWSSVRVMPSRRNASLVLRHGDTSPSAPAGEGGPDHLHACDAAALKALRLRLAAAAPVSVGHLGPLPASVAELVALSSRAAQNESMAARWPGMLATVTAAAEEARAAGTAGGEPLGLGELLASPLVAAATMWRLARQGRREATAIPVILAAQAQAHRGDVSWLLRWFAEHHGELRAVAGEEFLFGCLLWQCVCIALRPGGVPLDEVAWFLSEVDTL